MPPIPRKVILVSILAVVLALVWFRPLDAPAQRYVDAGFNRAIVTFASARALNMLISLAQEATVEVHVGVGGSVKPGAALDPIDDLVEQFSAIMLAATLSFAIQDLLITVFGAWPVSILLTALLSAWGVFLWRERTAPSWLQRAAIGLLFLSVSVPIASLASEATYLLLLKSSYEKAQATIEASESGKSEPAPAETFMEKLKRIWAQSTDIGKQVDQLNSKIESLVEHLVRLAAVFIVQTILLPLLFLWAMLRLYRVSVSPRSARSSSEPT